MHRLYQPGPGSAASLLLLVAWQGLGLGRTYRVMHLLHILCMIVQTNSSHLLSLHHHKLSVSCKHVDKACSPVSKLCLGCRRVQRNGATCMHRTCSTYGPLMMQLAGRGRGGLLKPPAQGGPEVKGGGLAAREANATHTVLACLHVGQLIF